jgi:hypothetical protein
MARIWLRRSVVPALLGLAFLAALILSPGAPGSASREAAANAAQLLSAPPPVAAPAGPLLLDVNRWLAPGEYAWAAAPPADGPLAIVADLRARTLSVYRGEVEIGRSSMTYGADDKPTPLGTFPILEKDADHYSNLYDNAPMPWMLRLTNDGVAIHGAEVADDAATHGCIGLPHEFAERLFALVKKGDRVTIVPGPPSGARYTAYAALPHGGF